MPTASHCRHATAFGYTPMRGLCKRCYAKLRAAVQRGTTWAKLEEQGKCGPATVQQKGAKGK